MDCDNNIFPSQIQEPLSPFQIEEQDKHEPDEIINSWLHYNDLQSRAKWKGYLPEQNKVWYCERDSRLWTRQEEIVVKPLSGDEIDESKGKQKERNRIYFWVGYHRSHCQKLMIL